MPTQLSRAAQDENCLSPDSGQVISAGELVARAKGEKAKRLAQAERAAGRAVVIEARVQRVIHRSPLTHWQALSISNSEFPTACGYIFFAAEKGDYLRLTGRPSQYRGKPQLEIIEAELMQPEFHDPAEVVFTRHGVPKVRLLALREAYGDNFAQILLAASASSAQALAEKLGQVLPRIREAGQTKILRACKEIAVLRQAQGGASVHAARALYQALLSVQASRAIVERARSFNIEKRSIYRLCEAGLSFAKADDAARSPHLQSIAPFDPHDPERIVEAARQHLESQCRLRGDGGLLLTSIQSALSLQYGLPHNVIAEGLCALADARGLTIDDGANRTIWRKPYLRAERRIAKIVGEVRDADASTSSALKNRRIGKRAIALFPGLESERRIALDEPQRIGPPGTGKTSCLAYLAQNTSRMAIVSLAARAAQHARDVTGCGTCYTVAQVIGDATKGYRGERRRIAGLSLLVMEEASMIGSEQMARLLVAAFGQGTIRVALFGDVNQLQPIDAGSPFFDLIEAGAIPVTGLATIYRHTDGSGVRELCADVLNGGIARSVYSACDFTSCTTENDTLGSAVECYFEQIEKYGAENCIIIAPFKEGVSGVHALNKAVRKRGFLDERPRPGEILMAQKNDHDLGLLNGMRLVVMACDGETIEVCPVGSSDVIGLPYKPHAHGPSPNVEWGYACTVHKFQGSEALAVVAAIPPGTVKIIGDEPWLFDKSAVYTAFSRAKEHLSIVGDPDELAKVIAYDRRRRVTALRDLLTRAERARGSGSRSEMELQAEGTADG